MTTFPHLRNAKVIAIDTETCDPTIETLGPAVRRGGFIAGVSVAADDEDGKPILRAYYPIGHDAGSNLNKSVVLHWLKSILSLPVPKVGMNLLYDLDYLAEAGVTPVGPFYDIANAEALIDETRLKYSLDTIAKWHGVAGKNEEEMLDWIKKNIDKKKPKTNIWRAPPSIVEPYAIGDVATPLAVFKKQKAWLKKLDMWELFEMESKLIPLLLAMRRRGIPVNLPYVKKLHRDFGKDQERAINEIRSITGVTLSPSGMVKDEVLAVLKHYGITPPMTEKGAPSITAPWLEQQDNEACSMIRNVRHMDRLRGTFLQGYILDGNVAGRVHCQFNQLRADKANGKKAGAVSGRFSCVAPWTPVITKRGTLPIVNVHVGDWVWTHKGRWRRVVATHIKGCEQMLDVSLSNGEVLTCTEKHRVLEQSGDWSTIEVLHERFKNLGGRPKQHQTGACLVPQQGTANTGSDRYTSTGDVPQRQPHHQHPPNNFGKKGFVDVALFGVEDGWQKPDVWQERGSTSQLDWALLGSEGLLDDQAQRQAYLLPPRGGAKGVETSHAAKMLRDSSHRQRPSQQQLGQSSDRDTQRARHGPRNATAGWQGVSITSISPGGSHQVHDITVDEDESYTACGGCHHNSSQPNMQNIPQRTEEGRTIRTAFVAEDGQDFWHLDYSQIEYRLMAHDAADLELKGAAEIAERYRTDPDLDFHHTIAVQLWGEARAKEMRTAAKTINFGIAYGEGSAKLAKDLDKTPEEAKAFIDDYHTRVPFMRGLSDYCKNFASRNGEIRTLLNRRRCFNAFERYEDDWEKTHTIIRLDPNRGATTRPPGTKRAFTYAALNARIQGSAADIMKMAMVKCWEAGLFHQKALGAPHLTVHDELDGSYDPRNKYHLDALREVKHVMETCIKLNVPLRADGGAGKNWGNLKDKDFSK
jgi:DNA polymerase I-like protein with 3'-5' exonuclease and polymerase domains